MNKILSSVATLLLCASTTTHAHFFIDYQQVKEKEQKSSLHVPEGFQLLTGKYHGLIQEIGEGQPHTVSSFGEAVEVADALGFLLPQDWFAYVDEQIEQLPQVSWDAKERPWTEVIADMGKQYGLRFIVDWDQQLLQISPGRYVNNDTNQVDAPRLMRDDKTGREVFIYTQQTQPKGYIIIDGEYVPVVTR